MDVVLVSDTMLAFGGGGKFALWLDSSFEHGTSEPSSTFDNVCLASEEQFKPVSVELWGFTSSVAAVKSPSTSWAKAAVGAKKRFTPTLV